MCNVSPMIVARTRMRVYCLSNSNAKTSTHQKRHAFLRFRTTSSDVRLCFLCVYVRCDCVVHPHDMNSMRRFAFFLLWPLVCCSRIRTTMRGRVQSTSVYIWMWMGVYTNIIDACVCTFLLGEYKLFIQRPMRAKWKIATYFGIRLMNEYIYQQPHQTQKMLFFLLLLIVVIIVHLSRNYWRDLLKI